MASKDQAKATLRGNLTENIVIQKVYPFDRIGISFVWLKNMRTESPPNRLLNHTYKMSIHINWQIMSYILQAGFPFSELFRTRRIFSSLGIRSLNPTGAKFSLAPFLSAKTGSSNSCYYFTAEKSRFAPKYSPSGKPALVCKIKPEKHYLNC